MNVSLNNQIISVDECTLLFNLLEQQNITKKKGIAIAVNNKVISKQNWKDVSLHEMDEILIISATQGG